MKTLRQLFVLIMYYGCIFGSGPLLAADYYISPSGSDATGDGSFGNPWKTIAFALDKVFPGDALYLRAGEYHEQLISVRSGTPSAYITIAAYGNEDAYIDGSGVSAGNNGCLLSHSYTRLRGFTVRNWLHDGISFRNCEFIELVKIKVTAVTGGISLKNTVHDFVLDSCIMYDYYGGAGGLGFDATPEGATDRIYNGIIKNCKAYLTAGAFDNCDGIALGHDGVSNIRISDCEVYGVGDGFDISGTGIVLERCSAHGCSYGGGYKLWRDSVTLVNCIAYNNPTNVELDFDGGTNKGVHARLVNCTLFGCANANVYIENTAGGSTLEMYNCILAGGDNTGLTFDGTNIGCYTGDYNLFHMDAPVRAISTSLLDFSLTQLLNAEWTALSGQDAHSKVVVDATMLFKDTVEVSPDLHLLSASLAVNAGGSVSDAPTDDYDHCPRTVGTIDIGAFEFGACGTTDISPGGSVEAAGFRLEQNYPNPFQRTTFIEYSLPVAASIRLRIVNALGEEISILADDHLPSGAYRQAWNADALAPGVYFCRLELPGSVITRAMIVLR